MPPGARDDEDNEKQNIPERKRRRENEDRKRIETIKHLSSRVGAASSAAGAPQMSREVSEVKLEELRELAELR